MTSAGFRRVLHASSAAVLLLWPLTSWVVVRWVLLAIAVLAFAFDGARLRMPAFNRLVMRSLPVYRPAELTQLSGAPWLWLGYAAAAWFPARAGFGAILATALADPSASLAGGVRRGAATDKSLVGTTTHAVVGWGALTVAGWALPAALAGGVIGAALERWSGPIDDNLLPPIGVALTYVLLA